MGLYQSSLGVRPSLRYYIQCPDGTFVIPPGETFPENCIEGETVLPESSDGVWRWSYELYKKELDKGNIEFKKTKNKVLIDKEGNYAEWNIYTKIWLKDRQDEGTIPNDLITKYENRHSSKELTTLNIPFDFAKPVGLIGYLIKIMNQDKDIIVLDFFSGSATTAHAVMQINAEDGGNRKYIMVQLPEKTDEKSEAYKAGYKNICEIGKERIRRAGKNEYLSVVGTAGSSLRWNEKRKAELGDDYFSPSNVDIGFRVLKLDSSNMKDVYYNPADFSKNLLDTTIDNIKEDRTAEDLLFQVMLDLGVLLSSKIVETEVAGKKIFNVSDGYLMACFDEDVNEEVITAVAKQHPIYFVMRDSSLSTDTTATNFDQIFETYSPDTVRKVI